MGVKPHWCNKKETASAVSFFLVAYSLMTDAQENLKTLSNMPARLYAFLIHLGASFAVALCAVVVVFLLWYPAPLHVATGVTAIFLILLGVDVVIGPMLTLLVYKPGKKTLHMDLSIIIALQLTAFAYGMWTVSQGRPAWLVFNADRFDLVRVNEIDTRDLSTAPPEYRTPNLSGPLWVSAMRPPSAETRNTILMESLFAGVDVYHRPQLYQPLDQATSSIRDKARPLSELDQYNPPEQTADTLARWPEADAWLPLKANARSMVVLLSNNASTPLAIVSLNPWHD